MMSNTLTFLIVVGGGCWCLKQWLSYLERKQFADKLPSTMNQDGVTVQPRTRALPARWHPGFAPREKSQERGR